MCRQRTLNGAVPFHRGAGPAGRLLLGCSGVVIRQEMLFDNEGDDQ